MRAGVETGLAVGELMPASGTREAPGVVVLVALCPQPANATAAIAAVNTPILFVPRRRLVKSVSIATPGDGGNRARLERGEATAVNHLHDAACDPYKA